MLCCGGKEATARAPADILRVGGQRGSSGSLLDQVQGCCRLERQFVACPSTRNCTGGPPQRALDCLGLSGDKGRLDWLMARGSPPRLL